MSGSRNNSIINLDSELVGQRLAKPARVSLAGREWNVRRDLTGEELFDFWAKVTANDARGALTMLMGEEAADLDERLQALPILMYRRTLRRLFEVAGLKRGDEPEDTTGESTAS